MNIFLKQWIKEAEQSVGVTPVLCSADFSENFRKRVLNSYTNSKSGIIWEILVDSISIQDANGWSKLRSYPYDGEVILFFDERDEKVMYQFESLSDAVEIIGETPLSSFYLADPCLSFLLCINDHDYLIGAGKAKVWVKNNLKPKLKLLSWRNR